MDNLGSNKGRRVRDLIIASGAQLRFLPPYSHQENPIESAFSQIKAQLRNAIGRIVTALSDRIGEIIDTVTTQQAQDYFNAAGYAAN